MLDFYQNHTQNVVWLSLVLTTMLYKQQKYVILNLRVMCIVIKLEIEASLISDGSEL